MHPDRPAAVAPHASPATRSLQRHGVNRIISVVLWFLILLLVLVCVPLMGVIYLFTVPRDPGRYTVGRWFRRAYGLTPAHYRRRCSNLPDR